MRCLLFTAPVLLMLACSASAGGDEDCSDGKCDTYDPSYESIHAWTTGECDGAYGWQSDVETLGQWEECLEQANLDANDELKQFLAAIYGADAPEVDSADGRIRAMSEANPCHILHALSSETLEPADYAWCEAYWPREVANLIDDFMTPSPRPDFTSSGGFSSCDRDLELSLESDASGAYGRFASCNRSIYEDHTAEYMATMVELGMETSEMEQHAADLASAVSATSALCHSLARSTEVTDEEIFGRSRVCVGKQLRAIVEILDVAAYR